MTDGLTFGVFDHLDRGHGSLRDLYAERLTILEAYDRAGFHGYHLAEHHSRPIGMAPSPSVFLAAAAQHTTRLRLATLVSLLPFYHPLRLIEEIGMLDQLSDGRIEIGTGRGIQPIEARFYGIDPAELGPRYDETLQILRLGLEQNTLDFHGRFHEFDAVPLLVPPLQRPFPTFWYGVHGPESAARAARQGFNVITNEGTEPTRAVASAFHTARTEAALPPRWMGVVRFITVAETDDAALRLGRRAYERWCESFYYTQRKLGLSTTFEKSSSLDVAIEEGTAYVGSPTTVRRALESALAGTGVNYVLGQFAYGDLTLEQTLTSIALFAEEMLAGSQRARA